MQNKIFFDKHGYCKYLVLISILTVAVFILYISAFYTETFNSIFQAGYIFIQNYYYKIWLTLIIISLAYQAVLIGLTAVSHLHPGATKFYKDKSILETDYRPLVSVVVPCYNEEKVILNNLAYLNKVD